MTIFTEAQLEHALTRHPGWRREGGALVRELQLRDFDEALAFVERVGRGAVDFGRHPDLCVLELNRVRLRVANLHHAGFTEAELRLLERVDAILAAHHPEAEDRR